MGQAPLSILSDAGSAESDGGLFERKSKDQPVRPAGGSSAVEVLRDALQTGTSAAAVLHATAEAARVETGASAVAIAVRTKGLVVCRARSGDIAPDLGSPLNVDSGISGECLRTATILICDDAENDSRVDPQVCAVLGIRSIVAVPLRGPMGIAGILEAFSSDPKAFGPEQIDMLRGLSEVAEAAYERECRLRDAMAPPAGIANRRKLFAALTQKNEASAAPVIDEPSPARYWKIGGVATAVLLISGVLWLSWRDPSPEVSASGSAAGSAIQEVNDTVAERPAKPEAGMSARHNGKGILRNAAQIESEKVALPSATEDRVPAESTSALPNHPAHGEQNVVENAPAVEIAAAEQPKILADMPSAAAPMPALDIRISEGVKPGVLLHEVSPVYPPQARLQRVNGVVVLDATVGADGAVHSVKAVSGPAVLVAAASDAVKKWRYTPSTLNGTPIEVQKRITVDFKLP